MKKIVLISLIALLFAACSEDEDLYSKEKILKQIKNEAGDLVDKYDYNKNGKLEESWHTSIYYMTGEKAEYKYEFNNDGQLVKKQGFEPGNMVLSSMTGAADKDVTYTYKYNDQGQLIEKKTAYEYEMDERLNHSFILNYSYPDKNTIVVSSKHYYSEDSFSTSKVEYKLADGNISEKYSYSAHEDTLRLNSKTEYNYDNKMIPLSIEPDIFSKNNITSEKITAYNYMLGKQEIAYTSEFLYKYEYKDDYPTKREITQPNDIVKIIYYEYK